MFFEFDNSMDGGRSDNRWMRHLHQRFERRGSDVYVRLPPAHAFSRFFALSALANFPFPFSNSGSSTT